VHQVRKRESIGDLLHGEQLLPKDPY
jgi:hypothetical protein